MYRATATREEASEQPESRVATRREEVDFAPARSLTADEKYRFLLERMPDVVWTADDAGQITFVTANVRSISGFSPDEILAQRGEVWARRVHVSDLERVRSAYEAMRSGRQALDIECRWRCRKGQWIWIRVRAMIAHQLDGTRCFEGILSDITETKRLEEALRQAQKMEAIGQLASGIAHDFNNVLAAILGNAHFLSDALDPGDPRRVDAEEIKLAAERAAGLTQQLLAFSRRQVLEPTIVDVNAALEGLEKMLRRLIGEDVDVSLVPGGQLGAVQVDVGQLEQVIMNLAVNARDAMAHGGKFCIETANVEFEEGLASPVAVAPGRYVMIAVSDTGCGMDAETKRRIFEPFFTTKEPGKGTGLGLSMCYGIVRQSGGYIWVYSELGHGTVFKIYLPRVDAVPEVCTPRLSSGELHGKETILLVEDDERVRATVSRMLQPQGYRVLVARDGPEAIALAANHIGKIDLLLSDMVLPGADATEVAALVREHSPAARMLAMSGFTDHAVLHGGALQPGTAFIQKPFAPNALARKVRDVLDARSG